MRSKSGVKIRLSGIVFVGLGGGLGAMARYGVSAVIIHYCANLKFPLATFLVNLGGCILIGVLAGLVEKHPLLGPSARLLLITGFLGGFTTFSAFSFETLFLMRRGDLAIAGLNVVGSVFCCLVGVWLGLKLETAAG